MPGSDDDRLKVPLTGGEDEENEGEEETPVGEREVRYCWRYHKK